MRLNWRKTLAGGKVIGARKRARLRLPRAERRRPLRNSPLDWRHQLRASAVRSNARKSGVSLTAMRAANPGVTPNKMRVGQVLNLPAP